MTNVKKLYLGSTKTLLKNIQNENYNYILGLGNYRKNANYIRIETVFKNEHGNKEILFQSPKYLYSNWELEVQTGVIVSNNFTNGPCNRSAYLVADTILKNNLSSKFAFIHIPKSFDYKRAQFLINRWLNLKNNLRG